MAKAAWAQSKARGPADVQQFAAATTAVRDRASATACRSAKAATAPTNLADRGRRCDARDRALATVASAGAVVNSQWAAHITMMANKAHTDSAAYHDRWMRMVTQAQAPLKQYAAAAAALARAPTCSA
jgi:prophage DNA circulation protein